MKTSLPFFTEWCKKSW